MPDPDDTRSAGGRTLMRELAHELRDALSPLASSADLARLRKFDPEASRLLAENVERGLRRTLSILDAFVLAEQCENGTLPLELRRVRLQEILQNARSALGEAHFPAEDAGITVQADPAQSVQVLIAVGQHAAAIAVDRTIEVRPGATAARPEIRIRGRMHPDSVPGEDWFAHYRGGDGRMSLRTAQQIMRLQGGTLDLVSGSEGEFELIMRFAPEPSRAEAPRAGASRPQGGEPAASPATAPRRSTQRVLIVEDSHEVRRAYREALVAFGYTVLEAADAEQALEALEGCTPDVALVDIHLPRMNGYRLAQAIRARAGAAIYLVMLSGMALDAVTRGLAREAGFDECLDKMAGPGALRKLLEGGGASVS